MKMTKPYPGIPAGILDEDLEEHMSENKKWLEEWSRWTSFSMQLEIARLRIFMGIGNNLNDPDIQQIVDWKKSRITAHYDDDGYCELCAKIANKYGQIDNFCSSSSSSHEIYGFTSEAILFIAGKNKELQKKIKAEKIRELQKEIDNLEEEIVLEENIR